MSQSDKEDKLEQESHVLGNGQLRSSSSLSSDHKNLHEVVKEMDDGGEGIEEPPVVQIERDLDGLTYSGAAINDLEVQLTRTKHLYQQVLVDGKLRVDMLRKKLHSNIVKSEPFIEIWRKARKVQEMSNKAAARFDKANSQHSAAKEMIRVAESQLDTCRKEQVYEEPSSPSPLDLAWQEMLNHATSKVVITERERRDSELEHRQMLGECKTVMDQYRNIERKLRSHIIKSRPYFQERYRVNQHLANLRDTMKGLELKINESKQSYSASLKRLETLNTEMHQRRGAQSESSRYLLDPRKTASTGNTPETMRRAKRGMTSMSNFAGHSEEDVRSVDSMQMAVDYSGSTGSLPSIGFLSNSEDQSDSDTISLNFEKRTSNHEKSSSNGPHEISSNNVRSPPNHPHRTPDLDRSPPDHDRSPPDSTPNHDRSPPNYSGSSHSEDISPRKLDPSLVPLVLEPSSSGVSHEKEGVIGHMASELVVQCLTRAVSKLSQEGRASDNPPT